MRSIDELVKLIKQYSQSYYEGSPEVSDNFFDSLTDELKKLDPNNQVLVTPGWGYDPNRVKTSKSKVDHPYGVVTGISHKPRDTSSIPLSMLGGTQSAKLDGLSVVAYYEDGEFAKAITRGNGTTGIDATSKVATRVIKRLSTDKFTGGIRGELVISYENWNKILKDNPTAEIRNYASGIINRDSITPELAYIDFVPYKIHGATKESLEELGLNSTSAIKKFIESEFKISLGLTKYGTTSIPTNQKILEDYQSANYKYPTDGIVFTADKFVVSTNGLIIYDEIAYKFKSETSETKVNSIDWNLTRTGLLIPVLNVEPIHLAGATISRCTAFNAQNVEDNGIGVGALVEIERSGEVIPDIQAVVETVIPELPQVCPSCGAKLIRVGVNLKCVSPSCTSRNRQAIHRWINVLARPEGIGYRTIEDFIDYFSIQSVEDLYTKVDKWRIRSIDSVGPSTESKLCTMVDNLNSELDPTDFLVACNIESISWNTAKSLVDEGILQMILSEEPTSLIQESIYSIKGLGSAVVDAVINNVALIRSYSLRVKFKITKNDGVAQESSGDQYKTILVTGKLLTMSRSKFGEFIKSYGYKIASTSQEINDMKYLVTNSVDGTSSKYKSAVARNIPIITEEEFINLIKGES